MRQRLPDSKISDEAMRFYWGELMAGGIIAGLPVAILYNFFLDDFISGITAGSVK